MAQIVKPQRQPDPIMDNLGAIGGAVGSIWGPAGAFVGSQAGSALGGRGEDPQMLAVQKRIDQHNAMGDLQKGMAALQKQPSEVQEQYGPVLQEALAKAQAQNQSRMMQRKQRIDEEIA